MTFCLICNARPMTDFANASCERCKKAPCDICLEPTEWMDRDHRAIPHKSGYQPVIGHKNCIANTTDEVLAAAVEARLEMWKSERERTLAGQGVIVPGGYWCQNCSLVEVKKRGDWCEACTVSQLVRVCLTPRVYSNDLPVELL